MPQPSYSAATGYISETFFTIEFTEALSAANPPSPSMFQVQVNGTDVTVTSISVDSVAQTVAVSINVALQPGDIIDFAYADPTVGNDINAIQGQDGADAASFFHSVIVSISRPVCFLRGTMILTPHGEAPVEALHEGDLVVTWFGGERPVRWIGTQRFEGRLAGRGSQPVRLRAGSLGAGMPGSDLLVSPGHAVMVEGVLAHAGALVNGATIVQERIRGVIEYFHIDLGPHDCVMANGAWAESYFEDRNRDSFHNAAEFHARFPGHVPERQATCLPIVVAGSPAAEGLRAMLAPAAVRTAA